MFNGLNVKDARRIAGDGILRAAMCFVFKHYGGRFTCLLSFILTLVGHAYYRASAVLSIEAFGVFREFQELLPAEAIKRASRGY
jgi:hypothetical protein